MEISLFVWIDRLHKGKYLKKYFNIQVLKFFWPSPPMFPLILATLHDYYVPGQIKQILLYIHLRVAIKNARRGDVSHTHIWSNFNFIKGSFASISRLGVWRTPVILLLGGQYLGWYEEGGSIYSWFMLNWRPH